MKVCFSMCTMSELNVFLGICRRLRLTYSERPAGCVLLIIGSVEGESHKMRSAEKLGIKTASASSLLQSAIMIEAGLQSL